MSRRRSRPDRLGDDPVIDLAFVLKDADGNVVGAELEDAGSEVFQAFQA